MRSRRKVALMIAVIILAALVVPRGSSPAGASSGAGGVHTEEVCFRVHNPGDPDAVPLHGVRYYSESPGPRTTTIVLLHGAGPSHGYWDVRPDFSIARNLAGAGYLVIAYDRLGYGRSAYRRPQGGRLITGPGGRAMLHEVVTQIKDGSYTAAIDGTCSTPGASPMGPATPTVVIAGDSYGGGIVSGYPGTYHDVAAAIPDGFSNQGTSPGWAEQVARTLATATASGADYVRLVPDEPSCTQFALHLPGVLPAFQTVWCANGYGPAPMGEITSVGSLVAENLAAINRVGPGLPVLLVFGDHDAVFPPDKAAAELDYWKAHCGCDVENWVPTETGHALAAHRSMTDYTSKILIWLASKGLGPAQGSRLAGGH